MSWGEAKCGVGEGSCRYGPPPGWQKSETRTVKWREGGANGKNARQRILGGGGEAETARQRASLQKVRY